MIGSNNQNPRTRGVQTNNMRPGTMGPPKTLVGAVPVEFFLIGFHDESGAFQQAGVVRVGDKLFFPQNSIEWARGLKPATAWMQELFDRKAGKATQQTNEVPVPEADPVDVVETNGSSA